MKQSYEAVGYNIVPTRQFAKKKCGRHPGGFDICDKVQSWYKCLSEESPRTNDYYTQTFRDAFHGRKNA